MSEETGITEVNETMDVFIATYGLKVGMIITMTDGEVLVIGNCTPYHMPGVNDGGVGWKSTDRIVQSFRTIDGEFREDIDWR